MRDTTEPPHAEPRSVQVIVAELPREIAIGFTTPEGERVCIVDSRVLNNAPKARENAYRTFSALLAA